MLDYKTALCHQAQDPEHDPDQDVLCDRSKTFPNSAAFYDWLQQQIEDYRNRAARDAYNKQQFYSKKQIDLLDLIEADVINFIYEMREEHGVNCINMAEFLDEIILSNTSSIKADDIDDEEDQGTFDDS
jgi:hypothetical protein